MVAITIAGAGPVGLKTGLLLKREGFEISILEEHSAIGEPANCSGLFSKTGMQEHGIKLDDCLINEIKGAKIYSPGGNEIFVKRKDTVAYVVDRAKFDRIFYKEAMKIGLDVRLKNKLMNVRGNSVFIEANGRGEMEKSKIIIGADGATSTVRHIMFGNTVPSNFIHTIQGKMEGEFEKDIVRLYFGDFAKGFFAWVIPENEKTARVGLGNVLGENISKNFGTFLEKNHIGSELSDTRSFLIPISKPLKTAVKDNLMLVGDAAFQTKATTGGGIVTGLTAAEACAKTVSNHFKRKEPLKNYQKHLKDLNKELLIHWKMQNFLKNQNEQYMNKMFAKLKNAGIEEFLTEHGDMDKPSKFLGKMATSPRFWFLLGPLMGFLRS
ncbi:MAG: NAD(P)/FAD-dependent oxidoreductase [Candidatus Diapherotrites archaeon]